MTLHYNAKNTELQSTSDEKYPVWSPSWAIRHHVRAIIAVLGMKKVIARAIPRGILLQQENRPFPRTLSSENDSTSYNSKGVAGLGSRKRREWEKARNCYKQCSENELSSWSHSSRYIRLVLIPASVDNTISTFRRLTI